MRSSFRANATAIMVAAALVLAGPIGQAGAGQPRNTIGVVLDKLPARGSTDYKALHDKAGRPSGEVLEMSHMEMWNVPVERFEAFLELAVRQGVAVTRLDADWNHALSPMHDDASMTAEQKDMMEKTMSAKAAMGMSMMELPNPGVQEYALTFGMHGHSDADAMLVIPLGEKTSVTARRTHIDKTTEFWIWRGVTTDTEEPVTLMWWPEGRLTGSITHNGHIFNVRSFGGGMHGVIEMSPDALPPEHAPMAPEMMKKMKMPSDPLVTKGDASMLHDQMEPRAAEDGARPTPPAARPDPKELRKQEDANEVTQRIAYAAPGAIRVTPSRSRKKAPPVTITLQVAYTKKAASYYSDIRTDLILLAVEEANQSFRTSGIGNVRLELVNTYETDYVESGSHFEHVFRFADKGDGFMDEVHALRDRYKADVNVLVVHDPNGCGLAAQVVAPADRAFAVVHHECAATGFSLAHEVGHLIGARHDLSLDDSMAPFPYGHGFVSGKAWRTMMSYKDSCDGCPRLPIWSSPRVRVKGVRAGDQKSDNARVISEQAARVAAFR